MLSGVTREFMLKLCSAGGVLLKHDTSTFKHLMSKCKIGNCEALKDLLHVFLQ